MTTRSRVIATPTGKGTVTQKDRKIADVRYALQVIQEYLLVQDMDGTDELEGLSRVVGTVWVENGEDVFAREDLFLHLADGRSIKILVPRGDGSSRYPVVGSGSFLE